MLPCKWRTVETVLGYSYRGRFYIFTISWMTSLLAVVGLAIMKSGMLDSYKELNEGWIPYER